MNLNRRDFLKTTSIGSLSLTLPIREVAAKNKLNENADTKPTQEQQEWMDLKFGMFIHFGINTYYDTEWSDGTLDPAKYNPAELDTDQWCRVAKEAGMTYVVLVTKHHDGFCNWPTSYTTYSVRSTPFNNDLVGQLVASARKYGLKVGFYYSLWDRHEPTHDLDEHAYVQFMKNQLRELLANYGEVIELWFDGFWKKQQSGWKTASGEHAPPEQFVKSWRFEGAFRWQMDHIYQFVKELQPRCLVMNNATTRYPGVPLHPVDILSGEKATEVSHYKRVWDWLGKPKYFPMQIETTMSQRGKEQFTSGSWFWHEWDHSVASKEQIQGWLKTAGKMNANLLLNVGPMANGKLRPEDVDVLSKVSE